ncbi:helix-turn-helix transcriptional regulator [Companilactobacillus sp.]|uniref:helix-turn-helix domain-containing protein n=1 Tax=Companilactobacillus sp. TaxID=2767905 RepID=UPI00261DBD22|nr:helix-turn-helix transcriptional regulator [Companilactobacillus sp.]
MSLKEIRKQRGVTQLNLVDMLYEDKYIISATVISNFEHGKSIEIDTINRIAKVLNVPVRELYTDEIRTPDSK